MVDTSPCARGLHETCPHMIGGGSVLKRRGQKWQILCSCRCHRGCPLWPATRTPDGRWQIACGCPGADPIRRRLAELRGQREVQRERVETSMAHRDFASARNPAQLREQIRAGLVEAGANVPEPILDLLVRAHWITRGPKVLVAPRSVIFLAGIAFRAAAALIRLARAAPPNQRPMAALSPDTDGVPTAMLGAMAAADDNRLAARHPPAKA